MLISFVNYCNVGVSACSSLYDTAKTQAQDLHFQHLYSQQAWGWRGREGVLLGVESRRQTPRRSKRYIWIFFALFHHCLHVVWLQVFQSFWKVQLACVLGSDHAARCVFTAFLIPPCNCWHTHTLMFSSETQNWNHWPLHTTSWHGSPPSHQFQLDSLCHLGPHEGGFFFLLIFLLIGLGMRRSAAHSKRKSEVMWRKEWKGSCWANRLWQGGGAAAFSSLQFCASPPPMWS